MIRTRTGASARVVVVEDSLVQRANLVAVLEVDGDIEVVGEATTAREAIALVASLRPDVVTLDLNIPDGGGQYALEQIMANTPTPVLVLSSTVRDGTSAPAVEALVGGALIAMPKPPRWTPAFEKQLRANVRSVRHVPVVRHLRGRFSEKSATPATPAAPRPVLPRATAAPRDPSPGTRGRSGTCVVAIGASTGGPAALTTVLEGLGSIHVPVMIVQHIHPDFVQSLVEWMARISPLPVVLAEHGRALRDGYVHIAPSGAHLRVGRDGRIDLAAAPVTAHRPSANQLFESVAAYSGECGVGVLLTGMGDDGATGLATMRRRGGWTIAQDEATSAVYGMPRAAQRLGAVEQQLPLPDIAAAIVRAARTRTSAR